MTVATDRPPTPPLLTSLREVWGVGPERQAQLARLGLHTVGEMLLHAPRRYEDRRYLKNIRELTTNEAATTCGKVVAMGLKTYRGGTKSLFELILEDSTGRLHCQWWNLPYMENYFAVGDEVLVFGKLTGLKPRIMVHPETEVIEAGEEISIHINRIAPIYPLTEGLPQRFVRSLAWRVVEKYSEAIDEPYKSELAPGFPTRIEAVRKIHFPQAFEEAVQARRRLALDEFVQLQREIRNRRRKFEEKSKALPCSGDNKLIRPFLASLGFKLTDAQTRVLRELRHDLGGEHPMRRLLQGDVGSGKTAVAACCSLMALESGYSAALMAPTEILATQHFETFQKWFEPLGIEVHLQTGNRKTASGGAKDGKPQFFVGTHALIESSFSMERLGLVIIDEQHKFGVTQREKFVRKGSYPHLLVMTATPIPRTLGLTLYGDLDVSTIDELPKGRGQITTFIRTAEALPDVWKFIRSKLKAGRQAYVVYPRIEESGPTGLKAVNKEFENIKKLFTDFKVGLLHGQLDAAEKKLVMEQFKQNKVQLLLSTPIIEVGVDIPNATIMVIENAEQFGLAQLHQLRGRIGRGAQDSQCILLAAGKKAESRQKLKVLEETLDGFKIAEADLKLRGPGELLGQAQSGDTRLQFGDLTEDFDLIRLAREIAAKEPIG